MAERRTRLYNGNMFDILPTIEEGIVDLAVIDLPYGQMDCPWDTKVELPKLWEQLHRISTDNATWIFFCDMKLAFELIASNRPEYNFDMVWNKVHNSSFFRAKQRPLINHEHILVFTRKKTGFTYCLDMHNIVETKISNAGKRKNTSCHKQFYTETETTRKYDPPLPKSIIEIKKKKGRGLHPTEKPEEIYEWLIQYFSREGNTILDPCFGSGNSGIVSERMNRSYIGIEMDVAYYEKAIKKIEESRPA